MPQLDFSYYFSQICWLLICFGLFFCISKFLVLPRLDNNLNNRAKTIQDNIDFANEMLDKAKLINKKNDDNITQQKNEIEKKIENFIKQKTLKNETEIEKIIKQYNNEIQEVISKEKENLSKTTDNIQNSIVDIVIYILENFYSVKNIDRKEIANICYKNKFSLD